MYKTISRSVVVLLFAVAGCGVTGDASPSSSLPSGSVEQAITNPCLIACKEAELVCMQTCVQDPNGGDCGCTEDFVACRATC